MLSLVALALLTALPPEHLHDADSAGVHGAVIHRHLDDASAQLADAPGDHAEQATADHDDHATVHPLSPVFQASPKFSVASPILGSASVVLAPDTGIIVRVARCDAVPVHSPPLRLIPSRAPPTRA